MTTPGTIALLTGSSLCLNPRARKAASALARAGHRVQVLGAWLEPTLKARDLALLPSLAFEFVPVIDVTVAGAVRSLTRRGLRKAAQMAHDLAGWENTRQLGVTVGPLIEAVARHPADLYIAHSEAGLCAARVLLRQGRRVAVDMEDWFSEDLLPEARRHRPLRLLSALEGEILRRGACAFCPSEAMAAALAEAHGCAPPTVIYNAFPWADREHLNPTMVDRVDRTVPSVHWVSLTLGPGRGIEDLLAALPLLSGACEVHLRAANAPELGNWVAAQLPEASRRRVFLHGLADNAALLSRIAEHDIGFAGELTYCRNKSLTISNKILHYLLGGLAVVASDTAGQQEVARQAPEAVLLYRAGDARDLARRLDELLASPATRAAAQRAALAAARDHFCWERQETRLAATVTGALGASAPMAHAS